MSRIIFFDRAGVALGETQAEVQRSWSLHGKGQQNGLVGRANFVLSVLDRACTREFLEFGTLIWVEDENLPAWAGVIDPPRRWRSRQVEVTAYQAERWLKYRRGVVGAKLTGSGGEIFKQLIAQYNAAGLPGMSLGNIWTGGTVREETLDGANLLKVMDALAERAECEWRVYPVIEDGRLRLVVEYAEQLGRDLDYMLEEDGNLTAPEWSEDGELINDLIGYGEGANLKARPSRREENGESILAHGRREGVKQFAGVTQPATLESNTQAEISRVAEAVSSFSLDMTATGYVPEVGDRLRLRLHTMGFAAESGRGFDGTVRVMGMETNGRDNVRLICQVLK